MFIVKSSLQFLTRLQHMATVEIIGVLLRDPECSDMMKNAAWERRSLARMRNPDKPMFKYMIEQVEMGVDRLPLPDALKIEVKNSLRPISNSTTEWLAFVAQHTPELLEPQYWKKTIHELIGHLQWNNVGCIDGRETLESYVSERKTINFVIWNQLCYHCMEEEIKRFSKSIDWNKCTEWFDSVFSIYWYQRICGKFPTKQMRSYKINNHVERIGQKVIVDGEAILKTMFDGSRSITPPTAKNPSSITYFRNLAKNTEEEFNELMDDQYLWNVSDGTILYFMRTVNLNSLPDDTRDSYLEGLMGCLVGLPFIVLIEYWISVFETCSKDFFIKFFKFMGFSGGKIMDDAYKMVYGPFEQVWGIYYRRFSSDREAIAEIFLGMFVKNDVFLLELMFRELEDEQRRLLLEDANRYIEQGATMKGNEKLFDEFSDRVLKNDEEKKLFAAILKR